MIPPNLDIKSSMNQRIYWRRVTQLTSILLIAWFGATFGVLFFARELSSFTIYGWPFSFYMAAQGLTLFYLALVATYVIVMRRLDGRFPSEQRNAA